MFSMTSLGSLFPTKGETPRFLQLYLYDTENKVDNRMHHFGGDNSGFHRDIVEGLIELLDNHNALYELPTGDMLGAIVYEPGPETEKDYGITIEQLVGQPQRVNKLHPLILYLLFPLLFVMGKSVIQKNENGSSSWNIIR
ncbi:hypothetical protein Tco_1292193 [Tanacetum coccineum]